MPIVRTARMIEIENVREIVLGVIFRSQVALFVRTIRPGALARVVDPANDIIVIFLFADAAEVGSKSSANRGRAFTHGMAGQASALFEEFFAMGCVAGRLMIERRAGESCLPNEGGESLRLILRETKLRHFRGRPEFGGVADPVRNPLFAQLLARFLQIGANFFYLLQKVVSLLFERFGARVHAADFNC